MGGLSVVVVPPLHPLPLCPRPQGDGAVAVEGDWKKWWEKGQDWGRGKDLGLQQRVQGDAPTPLPGRGRGLSKSGTRSRAASRGSALPVELISCP